MALGQGCHVLSPLRLDIPLRQRIPGPNLQRFISQSLQRRLGYRSAVSSKPSKPRGLTSTRGLRRAQYCDRRARLIAAARNSGTRLLAWATSGRDGAGFRLIWLWHPCRPRRPRATDLRFHQRSSVLLDHSVGQPGLGPSAVTRWSETAPARCKSMGRAVVPRRLSGGDPTEDGPCPPRPAWGPAPCTRAFRAPPTWKALLGRECAPQPLRARARHIPAQLGAVATQHRANPDLSIRQLVRQREGKWTRASAYSGYPSNQRVRHLGSARHPGSWPCGTPGTTLVGGCSAMPSSMC